MVKYRLFWVGIFFSLFFLKAGFCQEEAGLGPLINQMESRLSYLESVVAELRGKLEEIEHRTSQPMAGCFPKNPTASVSAGNGALPEPEKPLGGAETPKDDDPRKLYDAARLLLNKQDYRGAELTFKELLHLHPHSAFIVNSKYWLGEIYLIRSDYEKAAVSFAEAYALHKKGPANDQPSVASSLPSKAPEALLKLGFALRGQGKNEEVCTTLDQLKKEFPQVYAAKKTLVIRAKEGLKCTLD